MTANVLNHALALPFFLLLAVSCIVLSPSCKNTIVPPDRIIDTTPRGPDTTSHDFVWRIDTLGEAGSAINDVAIINDTLVYAVGEIYLRDTSGQIDPLPYNAAVWNRKSWSIERITVNYNGNMISPPLEGVFAFSATDIWLVGSFPIHGNGNSWTFYHLQDMGLSVSVSKAWGTNSSNMYFVGRQGSIAHFDGTGWMKLESGTTMTFQDVWGETSTSDTTILAVASEPAKGPQRFIVGIKREMVSPVSDSGIPEPLSGVWFRQQKKYYVVGSGIFCKQNLAEDAWEGAPLELTPYYSYAVRGTDSNDVFVAGAFGDLLHYNGSTWKAYPGFLRGDTSLRAVAVKGNLVMAVGYRGEHGLIIAGVRQ